MFANITVNVVELRKKYPRFQLSDLVKHKAIIYVPYSVTSFKLTKFYSLNFHYSCPVQNTSKPTAILDLIVLAPRHLTATTTLTFG